jgi:hypothetical protein
MAWPEKGDADQSVITKQSLTLAGGGQIRGWKCAKYTIYFKKIIKSQFKDTIRVLAATY